MAKQVSPTEATCSMNATSDSKESSISHYSSELFPTMTNRILLIIYNLASLVSTFEPDLSSAETIVQLSHDSPKAVLKRLSNCKL